jgi:hypothetical protein
MARPARSAKTITGVVERAWPNDYQDVPIALLRRRVGGPLYNLHGFLRDKSLRKGDTLVVWRMDGLGRSLGDSIQLTTDLRSRGVELTIDHSHRCGPERM